MNITIIGEYYSENLGDGVICESVKRIINECVNEENNVSILDISGRTNWSDEESDKRVYNITLYQKIINKFLLILRQEQLVDELNRSRKVINNIKKYNENEIDIVIFAGGQMFMDYFSIPIYYTVKYFFKRNIPVYFNCCGVGKNESILRRYVLRKAINYNNVKYISLRDNLKEFLDKYNRSEERNITKVYDAAFSIGDCEKVINKNIDNRNVIGLGVISFNALKNNGLDVEYNEYLNIWKELVKELNLKEIEWEMFTNGSVGDYDFAKEILANLGYNYVDKLCDRPRRPKQLINVISKYDSIISFRLHSHIIAYALGKESIGIKWDKKVSEFSELINRKNSFFDLNDKNIVRKIISRIEEDKESDLYNDLNRMKIINDSKESILFCLRKN